MGKVPQDLLNSLIARGLSELLMLHVAGKNVLIGNVLFEKNKLTLKDRALAKQVKPEQVEACEERGIIGAICSIDNREWESLTFLGAAHCRVEGNLSATRANQLAKTHSQYGDSLFDFNGSVYRAFQAMLDSQIVPVVVMKVVKTREQEAGLAVCDLRASSLPINIVQAVHDQVRSYVEKKLILSVEDVDVGSNTFGSLFGAFLGSDQQEDAA